MIAVGESLDFLSQRGQEILNQLPGQGFMPYQVNKAYNLVEMESEIDHIDGQLGIGVLAVGGIAALLSALGLGTGWLWNKHKEQELQQTILDEIWKYQQPPFNMSPAEAKDFVLSRTPSNGGFEFGWNLQSVILAGGSLIGLWLVSRLLLSWLSPQKGG